MLFDFIIQKKKANISILIIFVLLASSLIGVLTMSFLKQMIGYTNSIYSYHKSYYFSKAGLELALTQIENAGIGFSNKINSGDNIFLDNFDCDNCELYIDIQGKTSYLSDYFWISTGCNDQTAFVLKGGESIVLPLFYQKDINNNYSFFTQAIEYNLDLLKYRDYFKFIKNQDYNGELNVSLVLLSGSEIKRDYLFIKSYQTDQDLFKNYFKDFQSYYGDILDKNNFFSYIILSNAKPEKLGFCVHIDEINYGGLIKNIQLPSTKFFVSSLGTFMNRTIGLQAIYSQPIPGFLANTHIK